MVKAKKFVFAKHFQGLPKDSDLKLEEEDLPALKDGEALFEAVYLSVDPYMRPYTARLPEGITMIGEQFAKCVESKNPEFKKGCHVLGFFGWRTHTIVAGKGEDLRITRVDVADFDKLPTSLALGTLGMPGATGYLGLMYHGEPKAGETVLVNAAAGAVGSVVGQVAKIKGCKVIGYAGTEAKCKWLKELGFDHVFNYKTANLDETLKQAAPDGVNVYFDNVGGEFSNTVLMKHMAVRGRVVLCGCISSYNAQEPAKETSIWPMILFKRLTIRGIIVNQDYTPTQWKEAFAFMGQWIKEGKMKYKETVTQGFENMPKAFLGLFTGDNIGKAIVKV